MLMAQVVFFIGGGTDDYNRGRFDFVFLAFLGYIFE
jgi:hypothetical protein